jgi:hypothetical protein
MHPLCFDYNDDESNEEYGKFMVGAHENRMLHASERVTQRSPAFLCPSRGASKHSTK